MATDRKLITVGYPSQATWLGAGDARMFHEHFCATADGVPLPEEIADLFTTTVTREAGRVFVRVEFA